MGYHKVSKRQIMQIAVEGEKTMQKAIRNYSHKKHRQPKEFWMHGSTFFNGGYKQYLPPIEQK